jgi:hypothetical protein
LGLDQYEVSTVQEQGWSGMSNGDLLSIIAELFDLFITADKNLKYQQNLINRRIAIIQLYTDRLSLLKKTNYPEAISPDLDRKRKHLPVVIDLSALEKRGLFKGYPNLIHTLNRKRGVQWMVLYLVVGLLRVPWNFRIWRGRGTASPAKLAAKLLRTLPECLKRGYQIWVLFDAGITSKWLLKEVHRLTAIKLSDLLPTLSKGD